MNIQNRKSLFLMLFLMMLILAACGSADSDDDDVRAATRPMLVEERSLSGEQQQMCSNSFIVYPYGDIPALLAGYCLTDDPTVEEFKNFCEMGGVAIVKVLNNYTDYFLYTNKWIFFCSEEHFNFLSSKN